MGGCLQRHGEKVRSDREGCVLDTGGARYRVGAPDDISITALGLCTGALGAFVHRPSECLHMAGASAVYRAVNDRLLVPSFTYLSMSR